MKTYITLMLFLSMVFSASAISTAEFYLSINEKIERKKPVTTKRVVPKAKAKPKKAAIKKNTTKQTTKRASPKKHPKRAKAPTDYRVNLKFWNNKTKRIIIKGTRKLVVNTKTQHANLYAGKYLVMSFPVSTGKKGKNTPKGTFKITEKVVDKYSTIYKVKMPYWMRFKGPYGIHQGKVYHYPASHGCVRVPAIVASVLYHNMGRGSIVHVI